ncbi:putative copper resistance protein CopC [Actinoplanes missouriensis 431]|uniref:Putative copper resistance protein CopC n=1 Tax=Actinoplanes missouriensis (strain ATCC 14538 / DSM 43046 / CBS 188.64 / JCM 3121 / NBRC 102363 / NCIMB 12654 / NRRL B-3342 / UNCC 431) TaxID=512565 RepID=I0H551_ACTM4|nr:copper resistance CopC family protein [Actinoplanes missouriensis]BAL88138.1 putative copper resistance protein CopC [Actinoplanes missouriensis 431]
MRRLVIVVAVVLGVLAPGAPAWAHAQLVAADPAKDAVLAAAPSAVTLRFNERINPDFITIVVSDPAKQRVPASEVTVDDVSGTLTLTGALGNGVHTVAYRVVSVDGHTVQGSYPFTVADPGLPAAPVAASVAAAPATEGGSGGVRTGLLAGVGGAGLVVAVAAVWLRTGRRRSGS